MNQNNPILLFDGICNTCNFFVNLVLKYEKNKKIKFASLQSEAGKSLLIQNGFDPNSLETLVFIIDNKALVRSEAFFKIISFLSGPIKGFIVFSILPKFFTDFIYNFVAKNRYRFFGKRDVCRLLTKEERGYFLD